MLALLQELVFESMTEGAVWPFDRRYIRPPHFHGQLEGLLVTRWVATLHRGTRATRVSGGQLAWILPGVPHVMTEFSPDFDMWVIQLDTTLVASCWRELTGRATGAAQSPFDGWSIPLGEMLAGRASVAVAPDELRVMAELAAWIWTATDSAPARTALRSLCAFALRVTLGNLDARKQLSVAELASCLLLADPASDRHDAAAELGISEGFLSRSMQRDLGVTFVEQRARARVAHFLALVQLGQSNLLAAALAAGFGSYAQFFRIFRRVSGSRPRDYLRAGRRHSALLVARDGHRPESGAVTRLPDEQRQQAPL